MASTIDQELYNCITQLSEAEKKSILQLLKTFVKEGKQKPERISLEQYNKEIEKAVAQIERGEAYSHEEVVKMAKDR